MNQRLKQCPVCNGSLDIVKYRCPNCETAIEGKFKVSEFDLLNAKQLEFVKTFICCKGNIKEVEKVLRISYPTVKNRLAEVSEMLCGNKTHSVYTILEDIEKGKLSIDDAIKKIRR
jgi:hypothetical protein